jgi:ABC-type bacteriocin/lantibiotic exporter with double-glycine peptidase domain
MFYLPFFLLYGRQLAFVMIVTVIISLAVLELLKIFARKTIEVSKRVDSERYDYTLKMYKLLHKENFEEDDIYNLNSYMDKVHACDRAWIHYCMYANLYGYCFNLIWFIGVAVCLCLTLGMINSGAIFISTFIVFNSYLEQLKTPIGNYVTFKQITDRFDESFRNVFDMLDDEDLLSLKKLQD